MKIRVTEGYVGFNRKVYGVGAVLEIGDQDAAYLIKEGVAVKTLEESPADAVDGAVETLADDEMTLPDVDPERQSSLGARNEYIQRAGRERHPGRLSEWR